MQHQSRRVPLGIANEVHLRIHFLEEETGLRLRPQPHHLLSGSLRIKSVVLEGDLEDEPRRELVAADVTLQDFRPDLDGGPLLSRRGLRSEGKSRIENVK